MLLTLTSYIRPLVAAGRQWGRPQRALIAIVYTTLLTIGLVQSSAHPLIGPAAPEDLNLFWEILLTTGHVLGFGGLVGLMWWALAAQAPPLWALVVTVIFALVLGIVSESLQLLVPDRSASLFDLLCDWGVVLVVGYKLYRRIRPVVLL